MFRESEFYTETLKHLSLCSTFYKTQSSASTGVEASADDVSRVIECAPALPVLVGSGVTPENVGKFSGAHGLIVGSYFKVELC